MHETRKEPLKSQNRNPNSSNNEPVYYCPFKRLPCRQFDTKLKQGVCQTHANRYSKSKPCEWFPRGLARGRQIAVLREGRLRICAESGAFQQ